MPGALQYQDALLKLLPPGAAFSRDPGGLLAALVLALADEFARLDGRALDLIEEADPRTTNEMLTDWERVCGLPDPDYPAPVTLDDRRAAVVARLTERGDVSEPGFVGLAARVGWSAAIVTHIPFAADVSHGDDPLYDALSVFWWEIHVSVPMGTATPLVTLEALVQDLLPDHTFVTFTYVVT
jgi:uncharacterized protein YmfQ (DUF2313 family)